jgi:tape measure domain-containing protein
MAKSIDERIVDMRFNNQQFESRIKSSIQSLKNLKSNLDLRKAAKNMTSLEAAANKISFSGMASGIANMTSKFNALGVVGFTVIQNLTNAALRLGQRITSALTIDPIKAGLSEYELKMNSIQTILTNTMSKGTTLEDVNKGLDELNEYADKTIYNFAQMTDNIGKFTAAGVGLEDSLIALKGIGNLAAGFGVGAQRMAAGTYQISQALSAGVFKLIDWKSIELAGLGGDLFKNALLDTAKDMGVFVDQTVPFRETLRKGWLTTDVFIETMKKMAADESLLAAAQNVTTFTKLLGTMAEVMGSGWAKTWEAIIGGKNQATELWTSISNAFGDVTTASADARSELFKFWNEQGGRQDVLIGISNILITIADILKPIEDAFATVFKPLTGPDLVRFSKTFREITEGFKIGEKTADALKRTFVGVFTIFDIVRKSILAVGKALLILLNLLFPVGDSFLNITALLGDLLNGFNKGTLSVENINKAMQGLATILKPVGKIINETFNLLIGGFAYLGSKVDLPAIKQFFSDIATYLQPFGEEVAAIFNDFTNSITLEPVKQFLVDLKNKLIPVGLIGASVGETLKNMALELAKFIGGLADFTKPLESSSSKALVIFSKVAGAFEWLYNKMAGYINWFIEGFKALGSGIADGFSGFVELFKSGVENINFENIEKLLKGSLLASIILVMRRFINSLVRMGASGSSFMEKVNGVLTALKNTLEDYQNSLKANILLKIAISVGILTAALIALSYIDPGKLGAGIGFLSLLMAELFGAMVGFNKLISLKGFVNIPTMVAGMLGMAVAVGLLTASLVVLSLLPWKRVIAGTTAIISMMAVLANSMVVMSKALTGKGFLQIDKLVISMIGMSVAIGLLSASLIALSFLDWNGIAKGLVGVLGLMAGLTLFANTLNKNALRMTKASYGFIVFGAALLVIAQSVRMLAELRLNSLIKGLSGFAVIMTGLFLFMKNIGRLKGIKNNATAMLIISGSLLLVAYTLKTIAEIPWKKLVKSLGAMTAVIALFVGAMKLMPPTDLASAGALAIMAASMLVIGTVLRDLGSIEWKTILVGLGTMAAVLAMMTSATKLIKPTDVASAAVIGVMALSLLTIGTSLKELGELPWQTILTGLATMAAALAILAGATKLMGAGGGIMGSVSLLGIVLAINLLVPAMMAMSKLDFVAVGIGMGVVVASLGALGALGYFLGPLVPVIIGLAASITLLGIGALAAGVGVLAIATGITALAGAIFANSAALELFMEDIGPLIPGFVANLMKGYLEALKGFNNSIPELGKSLELVIIALADAAEKTIPYVTAVFYRMLIKVIDVMNQYTDPLIEKGSELIITLLTGMRKHINEMSKLALDIIVEFLDAMSAKSEMMADAGYKLLISFMDASAKAIRANQEAMEAALLEVFLAMVGTSTEELDGLRFQFVTIGENLLKGLIEGIDNLVGDVTGTITGMGKSVINAAMTVFDEHSPSEVFRAIGGGLLDGEILGIKEKTGAAVKAMEDSSKKVVKASTNISKEASKSAKEAFDAAVESIEERKYFDKLSLDEELKEWQFLNETFSEYAEYRKRTAREVYRVEKAIRQRDESEKEKSYKDEYNQAIESINNRKYYKQLSLEEELKEYQGLQKVYEEGSEERKQIDKDVYRVRNEIEQDSYGKSIDLIDEKKYYNELALTEELAAHKKIRDSVKKDSDMRKKADREIFRVEQEIRDANNEYIQNIEQKRVEANDRRIALEEEYYDKTKSIHDKLKQDIKSVTDEYNNAVTSRTDTLYSAYGLFDEIKLPEKEEDKIKGTQLLNNLQGQVKAFKNWQVDIDKLAARGVGEDLIQELRKLGPKSGQEIDALTQLSDKELTKYTSLWRSKHALAKTQATEELEGMRMETVTKIQELTQTASVELDEYRKTWSGKMMDIVNDTTSELNQLKNAWSTKIGELRGVAEFETELMGKNMVKELNKPDWSELGANVIGAYVTGMKDQSVYAVEETGKIAAETLQAAKDALGIKSPSKEFMEIGRYSIEGMIIGIRNMSGKLLQSGKDTAELARKSLSEAIRNILAIVNDDINLRPVITPVLDMSDLNANKDLLGLSAYRPILPRTIPSEPSQTPRATSQNGSGVNNNFNISSLVVREDADVKRIARQLQLLQRNESRG